MLPPTLSRRLASFFSVAAFLLPALSLHAQPQDVFPIRSGASALSLNGEWQFKYVAGSAIGGDASFTDPAFAGATAWKTIPVPAHWELHGFAEPKYAKVDDGTGLYRRKFSVPPAWKGQRVFLRFEGVLYGLEAFVNGKSVGTWASSYNPVSFDITDALDSGANSENTLAVRVITHPKGWEFDTNDCWALSGIYRDVTLFAVPALHFKDYTTRTTLNADGTAELNLDAVASGTATITGKLSGPGNERAQEFRIDLDTQGHGATTLKISQPKLWTAETPSLYRLQLALQNGGKTVQQIEEKIGLRQITIEDGVLKLNGRPIKLHGVDHHGIWPKEGRVATEELMRRDLELMRAANINFIRTSHYPPHPRFIELCDELGFYVMDEVPFGHGDEHLKDESYQENLSTRARATVMRDKNRPSVIVWSVGNENPNTPLTFATGKRVKELDPTRPICFPQIGSYFERSHQELPEWVDIYAPHYPVVKTLQRYATELKRPIIVTEYAHALGLATDRIQDEWEIMQANPHFAGGAVWMFQDQGILRTAEKPTSLAEPSLYAWPDATHYYDTAGNQGMDGIVYSDRTPQVDYWELRKVYAPVQIAEASLPVKTGKQTVSVHVASRYDFRSLRGFKLAWALQKNGRDVQKGSVPLTAAARGEEMISLPLTVPDDFEKNYYLLALQCLDEAGNSVTDRTLRLDLPSSPKPALAENIFASLHPEKLDLESSPAEIRVTHPRFVLTVNRQTAVFAIRDPHGILLAEGGYLHGGRRFTEAEALRIKAAPESIWVGAFLEKVSEVTSEATRTDAGVRVRIHAKYSRVPQFNQSYVGEQILLIAPSGRIDVSYDYAGANLHGALLEAGMSLTLPPSASEFRWIGDGPFSSYPGKDRLNEFGFHHLTRDDLNFQGNRRRVELALLTTPAGAGVLLSAHGADVSVENYLEFTLLSHNAVVSGRGNKGGGPETVINADYAKRLAGSYTLLPLGTEWPEPLTRWFGRPGKPAKANQPFYRSYDQ